MNGATISGTELTLDQTGLFEAVDQARRATRRVHDGVGYLVHLEGATGLAAQLQQHLEPGEG